MIHSITAKGTDEGFFPIEQLQKFNEEGFTIAGDEPHVVPLGNLSQDEAFNIASKYLTVDKNGYLISRSQDLRWRQLDKINRAIDGGRLVLSPDKNKWNGIDLHITQLIWARNLVDGWTIDVHLGGAHIGTIEIDNNLNKTSFIINR